MVRLEAISELGVLPAFEGWQPLEARLAAGPHPPVLYHRSAWAESQLGTQHLPLYLGSPGDAQGLLAVQLSRSRKLPGHRYARVLRFGEGIAPELWNAAAQQLAEFAQSDPTILRLTVSVFARDHVSRGRQCTGAGRLSSFLRAAFVPAHHPHGFKTGGGGDAGRPRQKSQTRSARG